MLLLEQIMPPSELKEAFHTGVPGAEMEGQEKANKFKDAYGDATSGLPLVYQIVFLTALSYVEDFLRKQSEKKEQQ